ncbi:MAG TPA: nucleotidyltransferase family protein [Roseiflexaceae bacterium]|nr:nucleotidyltransferase family protein [Roseiflexaceae bacterium]
MTIPDINLAQNGPVERYLAILREHRADFAERYRIRELAVFGSYVRNEQHADSDLDVLVSFTKPPSLLTLVKLEEELSDLLGVKVDLAVKSALRPRIATQILSEAVPV